MGAIVTMVVVALVLSALGGVVLLSAFACKPRERLHPALLSGGQTHDGLDHPRRVVRHHRRYVSLRGFTLVALVVAFPAYADMPICGPGDTNTSAAAYQSCMSQVQASIQASLASAPDRQARNGRCVIDREPYIYHGYYDFTLFNQTQTDSGGEAPFSCTSKPDEPPANSCSSHAAPSGDVWSGNYVNGDTMCADSCTFAFSQTPGSISIGIPGGGGRSMGTWSPTGGQCTANTQPPSDPPPPCSGGSCYDPGSGKFCSVNAQGVQVCVAGPTGGSASSPPSQPSGCSVNGASAACAHASGDPAPTPPNPPITDPGAQSTGQGNFSATSPGGTIGISVGTFQGSTSGNGNGGTGTNPGNGSGDNGDGDKDCTAGKLCNDGYTDAGCDAVPATSGDPLLSQMAIEAHRQRCRDQATDAAIQGADKSQGEDHDPGEVFKSDDGAAPQFNDAGFLGGGGTCPGLPPIEYAGQSMSMDAGICQGGPLLAAFVLFCAYVTGAMIAARLTSGG